MPLSAPLLKEKSTQEMEAYFDSLLASRDKIIAAVLEPIRRRVLYFSVGFAANNFLEVSDTVSAGTRAQTRTNLSGGEER